MIVCPNAKINIGLDVLRRRPDGYHDIESLFVPVPEFRDVLEVVKADEAALFQSGIPCDVEPEKNLCFKAFRLMQEQFGIGNINIFLYKNIPMGAGLGGGSSDAAFTLLAINEVFELGLSREQLAALAAELGSDCPFFVYNRPMLATGRGEILTPFDVDLRDYRIEVVPSPDIHISTPEAYRLVDEYKSLRCANNEDKFAKRSISLNEKSDAEQSLSDSSAAPDNLRDRLKMGVNRWRENVLNDFEAPVFAKYPVLAHIKKSLYDKGAVYASMTGSGSAVYGIFAK